MRLGDFRFTSLIDGEVLAGPSLCFPAVPAEDWQPHRDRLDRATGDIIHTLGGFLIETNDRLVLVDAGFGPRTSGRYSSGGLRSGLYAAGYTPEDVTDVIFTHLHYDHIGWATIANRPFFTSATYRVDQRDWDHFGRPDYQLSAQEGAVVTETPLEKLGPITDRLVPFLPDTEILPGLVAVDAAGHTPGSIVVDVRSGDDRAMLLGDLVHTHAELIEDEWDFVVHDDHEAALAAIDRIRRILVKDKIPFAPAHFPGLVWGTLEETAKGRTYTQLSATPT